MTHQVIVTTERLIVRTWKSSDYPVMEQINLDPKVMEYFPSIWLPERTRKFIDYLNAHQARCGYTLFAVERRDTKMFIGFVGLNQVTFSIPHFHPVALPVVEIGWRLASDHWGMGFATEAARSVLNHALTELCLPEVIAFTAAPNQASQRVMQKIGMQRDPASDFNHPALDIHSPLARHVLYRTGSVRG